MEEMGVHQEDNGTPTIKGSLDAVLVWEVVGGRKEGRCENRGIVCGEGWALEDFFSVQANGGVIVEGRERGVRTMVE